MKLWIVIYVGSHVGGSIGPLPYGEAECEIRASEQQAELQVAIDTKTDAPQSARDMARQMKFVCERHETRPEPTF